MNQPLTISRYLGWQYLLWFLLFLGGLTGVIFLFEVAELLRRAAEKPEATFGVVLRMGFFKLPDTIEKILPFVVLFSGMFTFWRLTRSQELIVARASGLSAWQFLTPAMLVTLGFSLINIGLINPLGAQMNAKFRELEERVLDRRNSLELTGAGLWLRQQDKDRKYLLHADQVTPQPLTLKPLIAFVYDRQDNYLGRIDAAEAKLHGHEWRISKAWLNWQDRPTEYQAEMTLPTNLSLDKIQDSLAQPNTISFWDLPAFSRALTAIGLPATRHELAFQSMLARPLYLCGMVLFAAAFALRLNRRGGILNAMMAGVLVGSTLFALNNVVTALGANQTLPVFLAGWAIPLAALAAGNAVLLYLEEG
jgi:lipopolysaccharide export system permease protein